MHAAPLDDTSRGPSCNLIPGKIWRLPRVAAGPRKSPASGSSAAGRPQRASGLSTMAMFEFGQTSAQRPQPSHFSVTKYLSPRGSIAK